MNRKSRWGFRILAFLLTTIGFTTIAKLLIEILKHGEDKQRK